MSAPAADTVNAPLPGDATLPVRPIAPISCAVQGAGRAGVVVTPMLSTDAVVSMPVSWLVTATPTLALPPRTTDVVPIGVHDVPSDDTSPENVDPLRASRSHTGSVREAPARNVVDAPEAGRAMNSMPPSGRTSRMRCADPGSTVSRHMIPAFANTFVFRSDATRTTICPFPAAGVLVYVNESAEPQMSAPAACTVIALPLTDAVPPSPTTPTSRVVQGIDVLGGEPAVTVTLVKVAVVVVDVVWLVTA